MGGLACWLFGHKRLAFDVFRGHPFVTIHDVLGHDLVDVECCARCHLVFWEASPTVRQYSHTAQRVGDRTIAEKASGA
jgi:hypothetical protein